MGRTGNARNGFIYEIDVAGVGARNKLVAVGECKWSQRRVGLSVLKLLQEKVLANNLPVSSSCRYFLFSRSGFSSELEKEAKKNSRLVLVNSPFDGYEILNN